MFLYHENLAWCTPGIYDTDDRRNLAGVTTPFLQGWCLMQRSTMTFDLSSISDVAGIVHPRSELSLLHTLLTGEPTLARLGDGTAAAILTAENAEGGWVVTAEPTENPEHLALLDVAAERAAERGALVTGWAEREPELAAEIRALAVA
jgi:hypothetical protein